jgi:hypothetical protein
MAFVPTVLTTLVTAGLLGLAMYGLTFRLRSAPPIAKAAASIGVKVVLTASSSSASDRTPRSTTGLGHLP